MATRILLRRGATSQWTAENPVLGNGEPAVEFLTDGSARFKVGNGTDTWNNLGYIGADVDISGDLVTMEVVTTLPATGEGNVIYLVPQASGDVKDMFVWSVSQTKFVPIGSTSIDLTGYATEDWVKERFRAAPSELVPVGTSLLDSLLAAAPNSQMTVEVRSVTATLQTFTDLGNIPPRSSVFKIERRATVAAVEYRTHTTLASEFLVARRMIRNLDTTPEWSGDWVILADRNWVNSVVAGGGQAFIVFETAQITWTGDNGTLVISQQDFDDNEMFSISHEGAMVTFLKSQPVINKLSGIGSDGKHYIFAMNWTTRTITVTVGDDLNEKANIFHAKFGHEAIEVPLTELSDYGVLHPDTRFITGVQCSTQDSLFFESDFEWGGQFQDDFHGTTMDIMAAPLIYFDNNYTLAWVYVKHSGGEDGYVVIVPYELFFENTVTDELARMNWLQSDSHVWRMGSGGYDPPCLWMTGVNPDINSRTPGNPLLIVTGVNQKNIDLINKYQLFENIVADMPETGDIVPVAIDVEWLFRNRGGSSGPGPGGVTMADVNTRVSAHDMHPLAHEDIRYLISSLNNRIDNFPVGSGGGRSTFFGTSTTAGSVNAKAVTMSAPAPVSRVVGDIYCIRFTQANTVTAPTLTISPFANANIRWNNQLIANVSGWTPGHLSIGEHYFMWDGSAYIWMNYPDSRAQFRADAAHILANTANNTANAAARTIHYTGTAQDTGINWVDGRRIWQRTITPAVAITNTAAANLGNLSNIDTLLDTVIDAEFVDVAGNGTRGKHVGRLWRNASHQLNAQLAQSPNIAANQGRVTAKYVRFTPVTGVSIPFETLQLPAGQPSRTEPLNPQAWPSNASFRDDISLDVWETGGTGATISSNNLTVYNEGTAVLRATVEHGLGLGTHFTQDIQVSVIRIGQWSWSVGGDTLSVIVYDPNMMHGGFSVNVNASLRSFAYNEDTWIDISFTIHVNSGMDSGSGQMDQWHSDLQGQYYWSFSGGGFVLQVDTGWHDAMTNWIMTVDVL